MLAVLPLLLLATSWSGSASPHTDRLYFLLTNDLPVIRLEYSYRNEGTNRAMAFFAGRQSNTYYIRDAFVSTNGLPVPADQIFGRSYEHFWAVGANIVKVTSADESDKSAEAEFLRKGVGNQIEKLASAMTFGVFHLSGPARKTGEAEFEGESEYGPLRGSISETEESVTVGYSVAQQTNRLYFVSFPKTKFKADEFPGEAVRAVQQGGKRFTLGYCRYYSLSMGVTNLAESGGFVPSMFLATNKPKELFVVSSNALFAVKGDGVMIEMPKPGVIADASISRTSHGFLVVCTLFVSLNLLLATWLLFRAKTKTGTQLQ